MEFMDKVSKRIVELREAKGETQQELADAIGITRQSLSRYEIAARTINVDVLGALAQHFNVTTDYLLGLSDVKSTEQDMKIACKMTGLSEKAIENIKFIIDFPSLIPAINEIDKKTFYLISQDGWKDGEDDKKRVKVINSLFETPLFFILLDNLSSAMIEMESLKSDIKQMETEIDIKSDIYFLNVRIQEKERTSKARLYLLDVYENAKNIVEFYVKEQEDTPNAQHNPEEE